MDMTQVENQFRVSTKMPHVWPESIDMDRFGNIYFTDAAEGTLYRIRRNKDNSLAQQEETLLEDFKRASGISIDPKGQVLYMGVTIRFQGKTQYKIVGIPLLFFSICQDFPYRFSSLKECAELNNIKLLETAIPNVPTDLVLGLSSQNRTRSLFVTTKETWFFPFKSFAKGKVVEVPYIDTLIKEKKSQIGIIENF